MKCSLYFIELSVRDFQASVAWYRDVLGLELLVCEQGDQFALFAAGTARLALKVGDPGSDGGVLLAFEVDDLDAWLERLRQHGVALEGPVKLSHEGYRRARLRDPDGHTLCLFAWQRKSD
jgi:catechol 2,3-dioxygenase-like lactoylglutathione lyase family enzyme